VSAAVEAVPPAVPALQVPARTIPVPGSVSLEAQALLVPPASDGEAMTLPPRDDVATWRAVTAAANAEMAATLASRLGVTGAGVETSEVGGVPVYTLTPGAVRPGRERRVLLDIHGGGLVFGGGAPCRALCEYAAERFGLRTWAVDYRTPPEHPYPTPLDDCLGAYRALLEEYAPEDVVVSGLSAGANLAAALVLRARDEGLALPAALLLLSPELDLTESGDSFQTILGIDNVLTASLAPLNELYADGHDLSDPYLSPLFGDLTKGFPPTFLQSGTRDLFLSNAVRMHRRLRAAGLPAELHVFEAMPHGGFFGAPEDQELTTEIRRYLDALWP
jgi:epsilon-lactone hydrolase